MLSSRLNLHKRDFLIFCRHISTEHVPVLLDQVTSLWKTSCVKKNSTRYYVDGTVGMGGHSSSLLKDNPNIRMLCIDRDPEVMRVIMFI
jgi:16S rRNA (cytosine1402-N4)-methyltransferase